MLKELSRLYRALVWEGFVMQTVAANENKSRVVSGSQSTVHETGSSSKVGTCTPSTNTSGSSGSSLESRSTQTEQQHPSPSAALLQSLKPFTPLLSVMSRAGASLAELMSLLVRISTSPLHRPQRRGPGMSIHLYHPPSPEAIGMCTEITSFLLESLKWEVPIPSALNLPLTSSPARDWMFFRCVQYVCMYVCMSELAIAVLHLTKF